MNKHCIEGREPLNNLKHVLKIMRITLSFLFFCILFSSASNSYSQEFTVKSKTASIKEVCKEIEKESDYVFIFSDNCEKLIDKQVNVEANSKDVTEVLNAVLSSTGLTYKILDKQIVVYKSTESAPPAAVEQPDINIIQQPAKKQITGKVVDAQGDAIIGANIVEKGTTNGTVTDVNGGFSLSTDSRSTLQISFIGYFTQEVNVGESVKINVILLEDTQSLEELVVVGYGTEKKANVIGSLTTLSGKEVMRVPVGQLSNSLAGQLPGAIIQQTSGEPGYDQSSILIRGKSTLRENAPLVVIDGIPGRDLNSVKATDLENITILKDASAAIYGARAANGVILVTTKRGVENSAPTITYNFYEGRTTPTMVPKKVDAATYAQVTREAEWYKGTDPSNMTFSLSDIEKYRSGEYPWTHPNTDWFDMALKDYARTASHNISIHGGTKNLTYYTSIGMQTDDGIYTNSAVAYKRFDFRGNFNYKINDYLNVGILMNLQKEKKDYPTTDASLIYYSIIASLPTSIAVYPNGLPGPDLEYGYQPMITPSFEPGYDKNNNYTGNLMFTGEFHIPYVDGLSLSGYYAYDKFFSRGKLWQIPHTLYQLDKASYLNAGNTGKEDGSDFLIGSSKGVAEPRLTETFNESVKKTVNLKINYKRTFNKAHNIEAFAAYEQFSFDSEGFNAYRRHFVSNKLPYLFAGGDEEKNNDGWVGIDGQVNYFGRLNYNYKNTYLFQFTFRRDGSLRFSKEAGRWGNFPSFLIGYIPSEENWWKDKINFIDFLKIRGSWGKMGNDQVAAFQYLSSYTFGTGVALGDNRIYSNGIYQSNIPNPFITWEVSNLYNLGLELKFLDQKMHLSSDLFYERRDDILIPRNVSVPRFSGLSLPDQNFGRVDNKGFEMTLGYTSSKKDFSYSIEGNLAFARNKIIEMDEPIQAKDYQRLTGYPMGSTLLYLSNGRFKSEQEISDYKLQPGAKIGDPIIVDYDQDGQLTDLDRVVFDKTSDPELTFGLNINLGYKNWDLSALLQGVSRSYRLIPDKSDLFQINLNRRGWNPDQIDTSEPIETPKITPIEYYSDIDLENRGYMRMKNLTLSYNIPNNVLKVVGVKNCQIYLSGQNLFLFYPAKSKVIIDPEVGGIRNYPLMKVYSLGFKIDI